MYKRQTVYTAAEAAKRADIIMILINDELQADMYKKDIEPNLKDGDMLMFAHGFNIPVSYTHLFCLPHKQTYCCLRL